MNIFLGNSYNEKKNSYNESNQSIDQKIEHVSQPKRRKHICIKKDKNSYDHN